MRLKNGEVLLNWPLAKHLITAGFFYRNPDTGAYDKWHGAIDMRCNWNGSTEQPVLAAEDGVVGTVQYWNGVKKTGMQSYGNMVHISHDRYGGKLLSTRYAHLSRITVKKSERVKAGQVIGYTGNTGNSSGAHLHFEVIWDGVRRNPLCWLDDDFEPASGFDPYLFGEKEYSAFNSDSMEVVANGIDVAKYQGDIDWKAVKDSKMVDFAYCRAVSTNRDGIYIDPFWERNYAGCRANGIPVSAYYYTYAADKETADAELAMLKAALQGKPVDMPVAIDVEENKLRPLSKDDLTNLVLYAAEVIRSWGFTPMIYSGRNYSIMELDLYAIKQAGLDCWIADYTGAQPKVRHTMWQYSSKGQVPGISGDVDMDHMYKPYIKEDNSMKFETIDGKRLKALKCKFKCESFPAMDVNSAPVIVIPAGDSVKILSKSMEEYTIPGTNISGYWYLVSMQAGERYVLGLTDRCEVIDEVVTPEPEPTPDPEPSKPTASQSKIFVEMTLEQFDKIRSYL